MMGAAPATEVKWCPNKTCLLVGTKSYPSLCVWAGVARSSSSPNTRRPSQLAYVR